MLGWVLPLLCCWLTVQQEWTLWAGGRDLDWQARLSLQGGSAASLVPRCGCASLGRWLGISVLLSCWHNLVGGMEEQDPLGEPAALGYPVATVLKVRARRSPILVTGVIGHFQPWPLLRGKGGHARLLPPGSASGTWEAERFIAGFQPDLQQPYRWERASRGQTDQLTCQSPTFKVAFEPAQKNSQSSFKTWRNRSIFHTVTLLVLYK